MKLKFKHQKFQADAAKAIVDVFKGQPRLTPNYLMDYGDGNQQFEIGVDNFTGWSNQKIVADLSDGIILENINKIQRENGIEPSKTLDGKYNLTVEMETGARVIIVTGCINILISRVSETFIENNSCIS